MVGHIDERGRLPPSIALATGAPSAEAPEKSVIWLWLAGGPTHVETFDPKMSAPAEYRSITGAESLALGIAASASMTNIRENTARGVIFLA